MQWSSIIEADTVIVQIHETSGQDPLPNLVSLELSLGQQRVRSITLVFDTGITIPTDRLERLDYQQSAPGRYIKSIPRKRAVRFSITEKCNYKCFFCHEEGLQMDVVRHSADEAQMFQVFEQLKAMDYNDFTFTGGEPLLQWRTILHYLDYMRQIDYLPDVKFVTNGRALNSVFIDELKRYPGKVRFNLSMHSLDPKLYHQVVYNSPHHAIEKQDDLARVQHNLGLLQAAEIPFKLNFVLLRGINTTPEAIDKIFAYALACGAQRIKFLELLITQKLKHLYPYYYRLQSLKSQLGDQLTLVGSGERRALYRYRDTPLIVELQSCTCSRGCNVCALNRDVNFTAELRYFPCFLHPEVGTDLKVNTLTEAVETGAAYISTMAQYFGDHSPIIIRDRYLTRQEVAYYYEIAYADIAQFLEHYLLKQCLTLARHRQLTEYFFSDGSEAFTTFEFVRKLVINTYDHHATEITQQHSVDATGSGRIETTFGEESPTVAAVDSYRQEMTRNHFSVVLQVDWEIDYYGQEAQVENFLSLSIGRTSARNTALVRCNQQLHQPPCPLYPLTRPVPAWLMNQQIG